MKYASDEAAAAAAGISVSQVTNNDCYYGYAIDVAYLGKHALFLLQASSNLMASITQAVQS